MKKILLIAVLVLTPLAAHAFDVESAPTDAHGAAFADDDAKFDNLSSSGQGGQALNFGGVSTSMGSGGQSGGGVQTGQQMMDSGRIPSYHH